MTIQDNLQNYLQENLPRYLETLREWVEINSFTANPAGVDAVGERIAAAFAPLGFEAERIPSVNPDFGHHLVLTRRGNGGPKLGLISHLDTVFPPEEEAANDFHWRVAGDRIYGPGTNDIKGGTLLMLMVLEALRTFAPAEFESATWVLLLNAAEETLSPDFGALCRERLAGGQAALVFEAGMYDDGIFQLVTQRKGMATYTIRVEGKAAHAGSQHPLGANAIVQLAQVVQRVADLTDYERDLTFNVGVISGGVVTNRVPHHAEARGEMRTFEVPVFEQGLADLLALQDLPKITSADGFPCRVEIEITRRTMPWPANPATEGLFTLWKQTAADLGWTVLPESRGGLSDGNHLWDLLPTIDGLGPSGENGHCSERSEDGSKDQEFATLSSFVPKTLLNFEAMRRLIAAGDGAQ